MQDMIANLDSYVDFCVKRRTVICSGEISFVQAICPRPLSASTISYFSMWWAFWFLQNLQEDILSCVMGSNEKINKKVW